MNDYNDILEWMRINRFMLDDGYYIQHTDSMLWELDINDLTMEGSYWIDLKDYALFEITNN